MAEDKDKETQEGKQDKIKYEKPTVDTVSVQHEAYGVVSNCSMGQTEPPCSGEE